VFRNTAVILGICASIAGCASRRVETDVRPSAPATRAQWAECSTVAAAIHAAPPSHFTRTRGGTLEIPSAVLAEHHCGMRVVDIRERDEVEGELGRIVGAQWVPQGEIEASATQWRHDEPIVLVCRSGRRSARAAEQLEALGFRAVASLTGGMLEWQSHGLPVDRSPMDAPDAPDALDAAAHSDAMSSAHEAEDAVVLPPAERLTADALRARLSRPDAVRWSTAASILSAGSESCIDGRSTSPVLGTPGGDVGELVLALTALEQLTHERVREAALDALLAEHADAFGRIYMHSDAHTIERIQHALSNDPRVSSERRPRDRASTVALLLRPPHELEPVVLEHFTRAEHIGCGHLRTMLEHAESYQTRADLVRASLRAVLRLAWRRPESLDFEVLEGEHHEHGVVEVRVRRAVRAHTRVPMLSPSVVGDGVFIVHPQVEAFVRDESAGFLSEHALDVVGVPADEAALSRLMLRLGEAQARQTLSRLARGLPTFTVVLDPHAPPTVTTTTAPTRSSAR
jgi:rhodanese-related sulfurtransferase